MFYINQNERNIIILILKFKAFKHSGVGRWTKTEYNYKGDDENASGVNTNGKSLNSSTKHKYY